MSNLPQRLAKAIQQERGVTLSPAETRLVASALNVGEPSPVVAPKPRGDGEKPCHHIRWMIRRDMPRVLQIENECFGSLSWSEEDFIRQLRQRNCIGMVCEIDDEVVGFMLYELHKSKLTIIDFAVMSSFRRMGVGTSMTRKLLGKLSADRRSMIELHIREGNLDAQLFFQSLGFRAVKVCSGFYDNSTEDAYQFEYLYQENQQSA